MSMHEICIECKHWEDHYVPMGDITTSGDCLVNWPETKITEKWDTCPKFRSKEDFDELED